MVLTDEGKGNFMQIVFIRCKLCVSLLYCTVYTLWTCTCTRVTVNVVTQVLCGMSYLQEKIQTVEMWLLPIPLPIEMSSSMH